VVLAAALPCSSVEGKRMARSTEHQHHHLQRQVDMVARKLPPTERDRFVPEVARRANGQIVRDAVLALLTVTNVERLAKNSGEPVEKLVQERLQARRRLIEALAETPAEPADPQNKKPGCRGRA
jgi:hypothetical protein